MRALGPAPPRPVTVFAFGKAAVPMARGALRAWPVQGGLVVSLAEASLPPLTVRRGGHPTPRPDAAAVGDEALALAATLGPEDVALALVSGGGSAMLERPREGVSLDEIASLTDALMRAGGDIAELNAVRRRLSAIKGGGLARAIAPARLVNVVLSDVPGASPALVASGPTCAPPDGPDPIEVLGRHGLLDAVSPALRRWLARPMPPLTGPIETIVAADNGTARRATGLADRGLRLRGEARDVGAAFAREGPGAGWVAGGETVVTVVGEGRGGRSLELALGALAAGWRGGLLAAFGTDGVDGTSALAGALVDEAVVEAARARGLDPREHLARNDAGSFFDAVGSGLDCGPTGTNVADLVVALP